MATSQFAACASCDKEDCSAIVIVPAVPAEMRKVEPSKQRVEMVCPACHRFFSVPLREVECRDVTDEQLIRGFIDGRPIDSKLMQ
jgi:hypothetical protein